MSIVVGLLVVLLVLYVHCCRSDCSVVGVVCSLFYVCLLCHWCCGLVLKCVMFLLTFFIQNNCIMLTYHFVHFIYIVNVI